MRFWDSSALVPLLAHEQSTQSLRSLYMNDPEIIVWWTTSLECASAIARLERERSIKASSASESFRRLDALASSWVEVQPVDEIRDTARRMLRVHPLRAADALQLAAAWVAAERKPATLAIVTLDERLSDAAAREGFAVVEV